MRNILSLLLGGLFLIIAGASCKSAKSGKDLSLFVPAESAMVVAFQPGTLFDKLDYPSLDTMNGFKNSLESMMEENAAIAAIVKDPKQSGVLLGGTAYMVGLIDPAAMEASGFYVLVNLEDAAKFSKMVAAGSTEKPGKVENFQSQVLANGAQVLWNEDLALLSLFSGSAPEQIHQRFFKLPATNSLSSNKTMNSALDLNADISMAMTTDPLAKSDMIKFFMSMAKLDASLLQGNLIKATAQFGKTKAEWNYQGNFSAGLKSMFGPMVKDKVQASIAGYVPAQLEGTVAVFALNPEGIRKLIRSNEDLDGMVNMMAQEKNLNFDTFLAAGDGQVIYVNHPGRASLIHFMVLGIANPNLVAGQLPKFTNPEGVKAKEVEPGIYQLPLALQGSQTPVDYYYTLAGNYLLLSDELPLLKQGRTGNNQGVFQKEFNSMNQYPLWSITLSSDQKKGKSRSYWDGSKGATIYENTSGKSANSLRMMVDDLYLQYQTMLLQPESSSLPQ